MKKITLFLIFLFTTGCATVVEYVRKDYSPSKQAVVRYRGGSDNNNAEYKAEIHKMASDFCKPDKYTITKEYEARDVSDQSTGVGTGFGFGSRGSSVGIGIGTSSPVYAMYNFVEFSCKAEK